jgi:hypothetical protein
MLVLRTRSMAVTPTSRVRALKIALLAVTAVVAAAPAAAAASTTTQPVSSVTEATTGVPASSLTVRNSCGTPAHGHASCLAQFLALRSTGAPVHPHLLRAASPRRLNPVGPHARAAAARTAVPAPQPGAPAYLQEAYDLAALAQTAGSGKTIAVVDAYDDPTAESDLATYRSTFGLPPCTSASGCFHKVGGSDGATIPPAPKNSNWTTEISLDLDAVSALCPNCRIELIEAKSDAIGDLVQAQMTASQLSPTPTVISDSWGTVPANLNSERSAEQEQAALKQHGLFTFAGIATVAASGDDGYLGAGENPSCTQGNSQATCQQYPAALPGVTAAGGTTMVPATGTSAQGARGLSESAWSDAGSGCDTTEAKPTWQTDSGCSGRSYSDLSADANPATGMDVYNTSDGGWEIVGGTSEASPLIAAYYALVGAGTDPSWAYAHSVSFNDPSSGSNGTCATQISYICNAIPRYDGPTGLGTISGTVVAGAPGIGAPGFGAIGDNDSSYTESVSPTAASLQGGVYPNGNDTIYWWQYGPTTAYGQQTPATDIGSATAPAPVQDTINGLTPGTTYHYRLVAQNSAGVIFGYDFMLTTSSTNAAISPSGSGAGTTGGSAGSGSGGGTTSTPQPPDSGPTSTNGGTPVVHTNTAPALGNLQIVSLGSGAATVRASVNTGGGATAYYLAYGTTKALGHRTSIGSSAASRTVTWQLRGLAAGKIYYLQAVAVNGVGTRRGPLASVRTSPVTVGKLTADGSTIHVALRCHTASSCRVHLTIKVGKVTVGSGNATVRGNRTATVTLELNHAAASRATHGKSAQAILSAISVYNGHAATVSTKFRVSVPS